MTDEPGMQIIFDVLKKGVFVECSGRTAYLDGPFASQRDAVRAAKAHCKEMGWTDDRRD